MAMFERIDREKLARLAEGLAVAVAVSLPLSTSATSILVVLWLLALAPTLTWADLRRQLMTPAGGLPVLLTLLGIAGMAWSDVTLPERWGGVDSFLKLLVIPVLMAQFEKSGRGYRVFIGFLIACIGLLIASYLLTLYPHFPWKGSRDYGVLVKSYIAQSAEFMLCAAVLLHMSIDAICTRRWRFAVATGVLGLAFLVDIFFVATSRTTLVVIPVLALVYAARRFGWKGFVATGVAGVVIAGALLASSTYLRHRVIGVFVETENFETKALRTSSGERITFWTKSIAIIRDAPLIGHGTGSITDQFRKAAVGETGARADVSTNPHNQTFAVGIQLGLLGIAVLWAMWGAHVMVFRGPSLVAWIGLALVVQMIVGSLFNSFLFDFTEGWLYVFGFGVAAGMMAREQRAAARAETDKVPAS
jgi:hypothetical protein